MTFPSSRPLVVAISSRALFALDEANRVFQERGLDAYRSYQREHEEEVLAPGTGFALVRALNALNRRMKEEAVEVVLVSRNDADTGLRVLNSADAHGLNIARAGFTDGRAPFRYLKPFSADLFLSANEEDVRAALQSGFAAALVYPPAPAQECDDQELRVAFDGDAVLFSGEAERVYREQGLEAFHRQEAESAAIPLPPGPFLALLRALHRVQSRFPESDCPIRTALVTARSTPAHKRAIHTLRSWDVRVDEAFFLGGMPKDEVLAAFRPHIFFDDQTRHCERAAVQTPTAQVLSYLTDETSG